MDTVGLANHVLLGIFPMLCCLFTARANRRRKDDWNFDWFVFLAMYRRISQIQEKLSEYQPIGLNKSLSTLLDIQKRA